MRGDPLLIIIKEGRLEEKETIGRLIIMILKSMIKDDYNWLKERAGQRDEK